jgi:hypothetical protein
LAIVHDRFLNNIESAAATGGERRLAAHSPSDCGGGFSRAEM